MAMHPNCIAEIASTIGRQPTRREIEEFEASLLEQGRELARSDSANWRAMTGQQRLQAMAAAAQEAAIQRADVTAERKALNLVTQAREAKRLTDRAAALKAKGRKDAAHAALFERFRHIDDYTAGVRNEYLSELMDVIEAVQPGFLGLMQDPARVRAFAEAVLDGKTIDPVMTKAARAYNDTMEAMRLRQNAAGADIGKLDYAYLPQPHDVGKVARTDADAWAAKLLPLLRRDRYMRADGAAMSDAEVMGLLRGAWETISTEGRNQRTAGQTRGGSRASRFDEAHRAIHFKDADSYMAYMAEFGRGSMLDAIHGHVGMAAKNIAMLEEFGANPASTFRLLKDMAEIGDNTTGARESFATIDMVWDTLNGVTAQPVDAKLAEFFQGVRNFTTAAKLQGVMLSAITDAPLQVIVAKSAGVPLGKAMKSLFEGVGKNKRELAHEIGIGLDEVAGELTRWHRDHLAQGWTSKLANTTMKLTLVEGWTNALRRGYGLTLSATLDRVRKTDWAALKSADRSRFEAAGITEADWRIWQAAPAQGGRLTKDGIYAAQGVHERDKARAVARLLGYLDQEAKTAVLAPDLMTRAMIQQGTKAGTVGGEMLRSLMLFKSFAFGVVDKHLRRIRNIESTSGKAAYGAAMMTSLTLFGAMSLQLKDLVQGKDPRDMSNGKFWLAAFLQGGGVGIFGDIVYTGMGGNARGGQANWTSMAGPVLGGVMDLADLTLGNAYKVAQGKETDFGADAVRFVRGNTPLINLWYLRGAVDHLVMHDLQEQLSPGYLRRMRQRARKDWGQDYWWRPGEAAPDRFPEAAAAVGE